MPLLKVRLSRQFSAFEGNFELPELKKMEHDFQESILSRSESPHFLQLLDSFDLLLTLWGQFGTFLRGIGHRWLTQSSLSWPSPNGCRESIAADIGFGGAGDIIFGMDHESLMADI